MWTMDKDKEGKDMALRKEDMRKENVDVVRQKLILEMTARASDKNDKGLRKLSKN